VSAGAAALPVVFAHTGHVLIDLGVFMAPLVVIAVWVLFENRSARRRGGGTDGAGDN
jgi:hypothetical protein